MKRLFSIAVLISIVCMCANAALQLKITQQNKSGYKLTLVGLTDPDAKVTVNGNPVHVYHSGSFGTTVDLGMGDNTIKVLAKKGRDTAEKTINIHHQASLTPTKEKEPIILKEANFNGKTKEGAYLLYSDGTDRLGGSKMGYIAEGVVLKVVGTEKVSSNTYHRVRLSENRDAYIPDEYIEKTLDTQRTVNTGSWRVKNAGNVDRVTISLPYRQAYCSYTEIDPATIYVDIFSARCNSNWITQMDGLEMIDWVDFRQVESDVVRAVIRLKKKANWGYSIYYSGKALTIDVRHTPSSRIQDLTIGLDAGHGGKYPGAVSNSGLTEKEINLKLVMLVKERLEKRGAKVVLSRKDDSQVDMSERNRIFRDAKVDLAISIHNNAGGSPLDEMGTSTYYKHSFCRPLAATMRRHLLGLGLKDFGLTGNFNFALNQPTDYPTALLEVLFMSSLPDEEKLLDPKWQRRIADAVVEGILDYISSCKE